MDSWVLCACQLSRLDKLKRLFASLQHPRSRVLIVTTCPEPLTYADVSSITNHAPIVSDGNFISQWWNAGLDAIAEDTDCSFQYEVMCVSSDMVGTEYSVGMLGVFLRRNDLTMVGPNLWSDQERIYKAEDTRSARDRVPGCCWMLAGESGLRVDEYFRWWYSDDDLEMQARALRGTGIVPYTGLVGEDDTPLSEEKAAWAIEDREKFIIKWRREPW